MLNVINFNFAQNYSNIKRPGYLYIVKKNSMSNGSFGKKHRIRQNISRLLMCVLIYRYFQDYNKNINLLYYEIIYAKKRFIEFKTIKILHYLNILKTLLINIKNNPKSSLKFKKEVNKIYKEVFAI